VEDNGMPAITVPMGERTRWVLGQVFLVVTLIFIYFRVRGLTAATPQVAVQHARQVVGVERDLGIFIEVDAQRALLGSEALSTFANWVYVWGHWPVIVATLVWLVWRHRDEYRRLRDAMAVSGLLGMAIFVTYPVAPPRLAEPALVDTVAEESDAYRVLQPPQFVNQYAAMPSLHAGWDLLVGLAIIAASTHVAMRVVGYVLPMLMAVSVVVTANHYLLDVVVGVALVLVGHAAAIRLERRRRRKAMRAPRHRRPAGVVIADLDGVPLPRSADAPEHRWTGAHRVRRAAEPGSGVFRATVPAPPP
jgi:membrane-associated phospholipid phosphatase